MTIVEGETKTFTVTGIPANWGNAKPSFSSRSTGSTVTHSNAAVCTNLQYFPNWDICFNSATSALTWDSATRTFTFQLQARADSVSDAGETAVYRLEDSTGTYHQDFTITIREPGPTLSVSLGSNSGNEGDSGSRHVDVDIALSPAHSANTRFLLCVKNTGTATFRNDSGDSAKDFDLTGRNGNTGLTVDGSNCHTYNIGGGMTTSGVSLRIFGDTSHESDETAVVELRRHAQTPSAVWIYDTRSSATYTIRNDDGAPAPRTESISLIWTETIPAPPDPNPNMVSNRPVAKEVHEGDGGTKDVYFYVRTERLHSSKLPFRVCVSGNATQDTTGSPQPEVEDDYQVLVDGAVQGSCFDTSIPANTRYKRMTIRVLNEDRLDAGLHNARGDMEQVVLTLSQAPGNSLPYPWRIIPSETGYHKLRLSIVDDDFLQQPVQFSPAEYELVGGMTIPRSQTRRAKEAHRGGQRVGLIFTKGVEYTPYTVTYRVVHARARRPTAPTTRWPATTGTPTGARSGCRGRAAPPSRCMSSTTAGSRARSSSSSRWWMSRARYG